MPEAAHLGDPIGHSPAMGWLLNGLLIGAGVALVGVAVIGTGGLAAVAIVGGAAATGAGIGEVMSSMSFAPKEVAGQIISGSPNVFIRGRPAARAHVDCADCDKHASHPKAIATGSGNVYINGMPAARIGDRTVCSAVITAGAGNVFIGGGTQQTDPIEPENLVPPIVHAALFGVGLGAALVLGGPVIAIGGLVGGVVGGMGGSLLGGKLFGEGSDGQKWSMLGGSLVGGYFGAKGAPGAWNLANRMEAAPGTLGMSGGNLRLRPPTPATAESQAAFERASTAKEALPDNKQFKAKAVAADGEKTLSGWSADKPEGFGRVSAEEVQAMSKDIGHELGAHPYDKDFPGQYYASHAEKQLSILKPNDPIGVSRPICMDCQNYFSKLANANRVEQVVTDPNGTWIFRPDGSIVGPE